MDYKVFIILLIVSIPLVYSFYHLWKDKEKKRESYLFFSYVLLIFVILYCVGILGYQITGSGISITEAKKEINQSKDEIKNVANTLIKISYIMNDGARRHGGMSESHINKIKEYQNSIKSYLDKNLEEQIEDDREEINKKINEKK